MAAFQALARQLSKGHRWKLSVAVTTLVLSTPTRRVETLNAGIVAIASSRGG